MRSPATLSWILLAAIFSPCAAQPQLQENWTVDPTEARFEYGDIERFSSAFERLGDSADTLAILQEQYLDAGSPGLAMFISKYDLTAERLRDAIREHPDEYREMEERPAQLRAQESAFRSAYGRLKDLAADAVFPPTYFLVGAYRGIGSGSEEGPLVTIEKYTAEEIASDEMLPLLIHEMAHIQQVAAVGYEQYLSIYGDQKSLLALTIREGVAEFVAMRVVGRITQSKALDYVLAHEAELWTRFQEDMLGPETGDWMWQKPEDPDQPPHVGYALGARIAESFYAAADDKTQAVRDILGVTDYPEFLDRSRYAASFE